MTHAIDPLEKEVFISSLEAAAIHAKRLKYAMDMLAPLFPISGTTVDALSNEQVALFDLFTGAFILLDNFNRLKGFLKQQLDISLSK